MIQIVCPADDPVAVRQAQRTVEEFNAKVDKTPQVGPVPLERFQVVKVRSYRRPAAKPAPSTRPPAAKPATRPTAAPARSAPGVLKGITITGSIRAYSRCDRDGYTCELQPGAFRESIVDGREILLLLKHDEYSIVARRSDGTLRLSEDEHGGLLIEATPYANGFGRLAVAAIRSRKLRGLSPGADEVRVDRLDLGRVKKILNESLVEISIVPFAAYDGTRVEIQ